MAFKARICSWISRLVKHQSPSRDVHPVTRMLCSSSPPELESASEASSILCLTPRLFQRYLDLRERMKWSELTWQLPLLLCQRISDSSQHSPAQSEHLELKCTQYPPSSSSCRSVWWCWRVSCSAHWITDRTDIYRICPKPRSRSPTSSPLAIHLFIANERGLIDQSISTTTCFATHNCRRGGVGAREKVWMFKSTYFVQ